MADTDASSYILRYDFINSSLQYFQGADWYTAVSSSQVQTLNGLSGVVTLAAGSGISITPSGQTLTIANTGTAGITQLTGDVTAGPGSGSQAATIASGSITSSKIAAGAILPAAITATTVDFSFPQSINVAAAVHTGDITSSNSALLTFVQTGGFAPGQYKTSTWPSTIDITFFIDEGIEMVIFVDTVVTLPTTGAFAAQAGMRTVTNDSSSTANLTVNGAVLAPGQAQIFQWNAADTKWDTIVDGTRNTVTATAGTGTLTPSAISKSTLSIPVSGAVTLNGPTGGLDGQKLTLRIINDASHSVTLAAGAGNFSFGTDIPSYTNSVSLIDYVGVIYNKAANVWHVVSVIQGF